MVEEVLLKLTMLTMLVGGGVIIIKVLNQILLMRIAKEKAMSVYNKKEAEKYRRRQELERQEMERVINFKEIEPYYIKVRDLFRYLIKSAKLNRKQVLYMKKLILNNSVNNNSNSYSKKYYENDAHCIYDNLKNGNMSIEDYEKCFDYLSNFV